MSNKINEMFNKSNVKKHLQMFILYLKVLSRVSGSDDSFFDFVRHFINFVRLIIKTILLIRLLSKTLQILSVP